MSAACTPTSVSAFALPERAGTGPQAARNAAWQLPIGQAASLKAERPRILRVRQGRLWITRDATGPRGSEDLVFGPGESLRLAVGERIVMEPLDGQGAIYAWDLQD